MNEIAPRVHNSGHWTEAACLDRPVRAAHPRHLRLAARRRGAALGRRDGEPARRRGGGGAGDHRRAGASLRQGRGAAGAQDGAPDAHRAANARERAAPRGPRGDPRRRAAPGGERLSRRGERPLVRARRRRRARAEPGRQPPRARWPRRPGSRSSPGGSSPSRSSTTPTNGFHQVDLIYAARLAGAADAAVLRDPGGVVNRLRWVDADALSRLRFKPDSLARLAFGPEGPVLYDPLETAGALIRRRPTRGRNAWSAGSRPPPGACCGCALP